MRVILIIPVYNEEKSVGKLLQLLNNEYPEYDYVVVNDCSSDGTEKIVRQYTNNIINLPINLGLSGAVKTGMLYAEKKQYDICVQIDGDGQHRPDYVGALVREIESGTDIAIGSRFLNNEVKYKQTLFRRLGAKWLSLLAKFQSGLILTDPTSGMRAYDRKVYSKFLNDINARPEPDTIVMFARNKYKVKEVAVKMHEREAGKSHLGGLISSARYMIHTTMAIVLNPRRKVK